MTGRERKAIGRLPARAWGVAIEANCRHRDGAHVAVLIGLLPPGTLDDYRTGTRIPIHREGPYPRAQLDAFEERDGWACHQHHRTRFTTESRKYS